MHVDTLEVGWPLGKRDYLRVIDITSEIERETVEPTALVASGVPWPPAPCWPAPTAGSSGPARLLETSRGTVGRADATDVDAALSEADVVTEARTVLADTARRGSTPEEREAVARWLTEAVRRSTK